MEGGDSQQAVACRRASLAGAFGLLLLTCGYVMYHDAGGHTTHHRAPGGGGSGAGRWPLPGLLRKVRAEPVGKPHTSNFKVVFEAEGEPISPWHDLPLLAGERTLNCVIEIPKNSRAKFEVNTRRAYNPIIQDLKNGSLRYYYQEIGWNYGMLPQTWEDPFVTQQPQIEAIGDNDPLDVVEIGQARQETASIVKVKVLGAFALIDSGELDWKVVVISVDDPMAPEVEGVDDVEERVPGLMDDIKDWFTWYKVPDGREPNTVAFDGGMLGPDEAVQVVMATHGYWRDLVTGKVPSRGLWLPTHPPSQP